MRDQTVHSGLFREGFVLCGGYGNSIYRPLFARYSQLCRAETEGEAMNTFWTGFAFGAGTVSILGVLCRSVLLANAERHYRAAYTATLTPEAYERLVSAEASGIATWRQFRDQESSAGR